MFCLVSRLGLCHASLCVRFFLSIVFLHESVWFMPISLSLLGILTISFFCVCAFLSSLCVFLFLVLFFLFAFQLLGIWRLCYRLDRIVAKSLWSFFFLVFLKKSPCSFFFFLSCVHYPDPASSKINTQSFSSQTPPPFFVTNCFPFSDCTR